MALQVALGLGALAVFLLDLSLPPGWATGVLYVLVLLVSSWLPKTTQVWQVAGVCLSLVWLDVLLAPACSAELMNLQVFNRVLTTLALGLTAWLVVLRKHVFDKLIDAREAQEAAQRLALVGNWKLDASGRLTGSIEAMRLLDSCRTQTELLEHVPEPERESFRSLLGDPHTGGFEQLVGERILSFQVVHLGPERAGTVQDVTDRSRLERERRRLLGSLERKARELEELIFVSSHDLRSPLVNLQGFSHELQLACQVLTNALQTSSDARVLHLITRDIPESLGFIMNNAERMQALLDGLLRISRLGRQALRPRPLEMTELVQGVVATLEFQIQQMGARVEIGELPPGFADEMLVGQSFANLLDNALKYRSPDRTPEIRIYGHQQSATENVYCMEDNGIGIEPHQQARVFEIFQRLNPGKTEGEGLGLTVVRRNIENSGGRVWLESTPGVGSRFYLALPATTPPAGRVDALTPAQSNPPTGELRA